MDIHNLVANLEIKATTSGVDAAASAMKTLDAAQTQAARGALSLEKAAAIVEPRWDTVAKIEQQAARDTLTLNKALAQGCIEAERVGRLQDTMASRIDAARQKQEAATSAMRLGTGAVNDNAKSLDAHSSSTNLNRMQLMELAHVARSSFDALAAGASPMRVLAVESGRVVQALSSGPEGVTGSLRALATTVAGVLTPTMLLFGTVAIGAAAAASSLYRLRSEQEALTVALNGAGRAAGVGAAGLHSIADSAADRGGFSRSTATDLAGGFASTGQLGASMIGSLIEQTRQYAKVTGQDIPAAGKDLAQAFSDPSKGADELIKRLGMLDDRTRQNIKSMQDQGNLLGAQALLLNKLGAATIKRLTPRASWRRRGSA
jgi:hypothetical protein